ncbi:hypothetical protein MF271_23730 (plasmid) [Deinococcus sp. KNUC1210]|uniref:UvrD-helicase domain-containing protein n=1 Tax=Deinococcus sp. KNUC1210 TaxID=2917691 RepID=UPI001EF11BC4|nr:UvrD-helicase domain-containing protein [Deinococcus sp. KNUC1210]ULH17975.1 hypothetical protein MF271_23730 [Deinococcus sp. KNUC1210]
MTDEEEAVVLQQLNVEVSRLIGRVFAGMLPVTEARRLLQDETFLRHAPQTHLPDAMIQLLSDPLASVAKPRRSFADVTELPLMLSVAGLLDGLGKRNGYALEPYDHILLDEAQDFAPLLYALLQRAARPGHLSALGDLNQGLHGYKGPNAWADVQGALGWADVRTLSRTYRSTR